MNIFTVDLEDWYHANYHSVDTRNLPSRLTKPTLKILDLLKRTGSQATFFVLGEVAQAHPDLIKEIHHQGHEIANHSHSHQLVYSLTPTEFETDLEKSTSVLSKITKHQPLGYRAPSWSVNPTKTPWFWKILKKHNYQYSSSLFPFKTFLYGDSSAPLTPHKINGLLEIPPTVASIFKIRIPFSGGFYLRFLPTPAIKLLSRFNTQNMYYIHPREIDSSQPRLPNLSPKENFIHYYNISQTYHKLEELLKQSTSSIIQTL